MSSETNHTIVIGPLAAGVLFNTFLYGICLTQFFTYFTGERQGKDRWFIRYLVIYAFVVDTTATAAMVYMIWYICIKNFNNPSILEVGVWPLEITAIFHVLSSFPVQIFLSWRIHMFDRRWSIFAGFLVASTTVAGLAIATAVGTLRSHKITEYATLIPTVAAWLSITVVLDITLSGFLIFYLMRGKNNSTNQATNTVVSRIIKTSIECAGLIAVFCSLQLAVGTIIPHYNFHFMFGILQGRFYSNTLLRSLNSRNGLRDTLNESQDSV